jgi:hypothetical protein
VGAAAALLRQKVAQFVALLMKKLTVNVTDWYILPISQLHKSCNAGISPSLLAGEVKGGRFSSSHNAPRSLWAGKRGRAVNPHYARRENRWALEARFESSIGSDGYEQ